MTDLGLLRQLFHELGEVLRLAERKGATMSETPETVPDEADVLELDGDEADPEAEDA